MALTEEQIELLMRAIDRNGDGFISYNEFLRAFKIVDTKRGDLLDCSSSTSSFCSSVSPRPSDASAVATAAAAATGAAR